jgi:hypothetical protein
MFIFVLSIQGDQIGRIFACWVIVFSGQFFNYKSSPDLWATFFQDVSWVLISTKNRLGYILVDFL